MVDHVVPHFHNQAGVPEIGIGVREFQCIGALPPFDHPHVFLDMGDDDDIICPYCSTHFRYHGGLAASETEPPGCAYGDGSQVAAAASG